MFSLMKQSVPVDTKVVPVSNEFIVVDSSLAKATPKRLIKLVHFLHSPKRFVKFSVPNEYKGKRKKKSGKIGLPPQIEVTPRLRQTFRFYTTSSISARPITIRQIFGSLGGICTVVNSALRCFATSFRLMSLDMYLPNGGQGELSWVVDNTDQGPDESYDVTIPANISVSEGIHTSPPRWSVVADWVNAAADLTDEVFRVSCSTTGAVIDMDIEYTLPNDFTPTSITIAAGVLSTAYYLSLDQGGGNNITAINRPTTA